MTLSSRQISLPLRRKLLQNAVAGLMVLANRRAGMFRREDISELALAYLREGLTVSRAEGAKLDDAVAERSRRTSNARPWI